MRPLRKCGLLVATLALVASACGSSPPVQKIEAAALNSPAPREGTPEGATTTTSTLPPAPPPTTTTAAVPRPLERPVTRSATPRTTAAPTPTGGGWPDDAFWKRLSNCESSTGAGGNGGGYFQFSPDTAKRVGYHAGMSYGEQLSLAKKWLSMIGLSNGGTTSGWPHCWWVAKRGG